MNNEKSVRYLRALFTLESSSKRLEKIDVADEEMVSQEVRDVILEHRDAARDLVKILVEELSATKAPPKGHRV